MILCSLEEVGLEISSFTLFPHLYSSAIYFWFITSPTGGMQSIATSVAACLSVCLSVHVTYLKTTWPNSARNF